MGGAESFSSSSSSFSSTGSTTVLADAFLTELMPFRPAVIDNCTHNIVLRTRPDPAPTLVKKGPGVFEKVIARRTLQRYLLHQAISYMMSLQHVIVYAKDLLLLNVAALGPEEGVRVNEKSVHILPIATSEDCREVGQLEGNRAKTLEGMRDGARRVYLRPFCQKWG